MYFPGGRGPGKAEEGKRPAVAAPTRWLSMARPDSSGGGGPWTDRWGPKSRPSILRGSAAVSLPTRPAGLFQLYLKVRPRCSPSVLGWRALRGVHGGGQRGLRSTTGQRPGAHERPAVSPLRAAERRCARRRTRRLGEGIRWAAEDTEEEERGKKGGGEKKRKQVSESRLALQGRRVANQADGQK